MLLDLLLQLIENRTLILREIVGWHRFTSVYTGLNILPYFNSFVRRPPFLYPLKTSENLTIFWCFQEVEKGCIRNNWANQFILIEDLRDKQLNCWSFYKFFFNDLSRSSKIFLVIIRNGKNNIYC